MQRRHSRAVFKGSVQVGAGAPVSVQSMTTTHTEDVAATVRQVLELEDLGCHIIRVAVPTLPAARAIADIKKQIHIPLVADIHFDHRLALESIARGADCVRINPGNLRSRDDVAAVVRAAAAARISIRVGVNSGSIRLRGGRSPAFAEASAGLPATADEGVRPRNPEPDSLRSGPAHPGSPEAASSTKPDLAALMVDTALDHCAFIESLGFRDLVLSLKASDVPTTMAAYRAAAARCDYPLHLGVTAAGPIDTATVKSAIGIGGLLAEGIGDTIRVSLTGPPHGEVRLGHEILRALELERTGVQIVSCPTCGRCEIDLLRLVEDVQRRMPAVDRPLTVAVMGCVVNGPGEAAEADVGVAGGKGFGFLFRAGKKLRKVPENQLADELIREIQHLTRHG